MATNPNAFSPLNVALVVLGIVGLAFVIMWGVVSFKEADAGAKKARYEACVAVENEGIRAFCIEGA